MLDNSSAFTFMEAIRRAEIDLLDSDTLDEHRAAIVSILPNIAYFADADVHLFAKKYALYRAFALVHQAYIHSREYSPSRLNIEPESLKSFVQLSQAGPLILAPLHVGPVGPGIAILASAVPLTAVVVPTKDMELAFKDVQSKVDIEVVPIGFDSVIRCRDAIKRGRVVVIAPDMLPDNTQPTCKVEFFGAKIRAPLGLPLLAKSVGAKVLPFAFRYDDCAKYSYTFSSAIESPGNEVECQFLMQEIIHFLENQLRRKNGWEWFGWKYLQQQLDEPSIPARN
jgi:lauroyl/myristoyl acyltransferase